MNEQSGNSSFNLAKLIDDAKTVITNPTGFYRAMPKTGGYAEPVIFVVVMAFLVGLITTVLAILGVGMAGGVMAGMAAVIVLPIGAVIGSFVGSLFMFVIWKLMGSPHGFETAYRSVAYAAAIYPIMFFLALIPYIGAIIGTLWGMYLLFVASQEVHAIKRQTALVVFGVLALLAVFVRVSGEIASRKVAAGFGEFGKSMEEFGQQMEKAEAGKQGSKQMDKMLDDMQNASPEEAGRSVGEFLKGMEEALQATQDQDKTEPEAQ